MQNTSEKIQKIIEIRERRRFGQAQSEVFIRLGNLQRQFFSISNDDVELQKYFPIALVACIESFFKLSIREFIDNQEIYLARAKSIDAGLKVDFEAIEALHGQKITIGELVAHSVQISTLSHILSKMDKLVDGSYRSKLAGVRDRWEVEREGKPDMPIISDVDEMFAGVETTFRMRHIFCHEFATGYEFEKQDVEQCFSATSLFLKAAGELHSQIMFPNAPLTQTDMNISAHDAYKELEAELSEIDASFIEVLDTEDRSRYRNIQEIWESLKMATVEFQGVQYAGGSMRPMIEASAASDMTRKRILEVRELRSDITEV